MCDYVCISRRYARMLAFAVFMSMCVDVKAMLSLYVVNLTGACGAGIYDVYNMLNGVGDRTPPCGTPVLNWRCVDVLFL